MSTAYHQPPPGHYRLLDGVRIVSQEDGSAVAVCDYPLRLVRLSSTAAHLLALCQEERTCEQLAQATNLPIKRVEMLCDQLRWKGLLEAGPVLPPSTWPGVSIVIPSYNRAKELERCLRSLCTMDYPADCLEIVVVDDASTDETGSTLQRMAQEVAKAGLEMRVVRHEKQQGVGIGRNTGAGAARHELIAYIDSDCVASPGWLRELVPAFQDARVVVVGGMIRAYERSTLLGRYEDVRSSLFMGTRAQQVRLEGPLTYVPTANMLVRRMAWQQAGGFAPMTQGEDVDFCRRLLMSGATIHYLPQGGVYHEYRTMLGAFLRIRAAYASAEAALLKRFPGERRILLLPPEQATFAIVVIGGVWAILWCCAWFGTGGMTAALCLLLLLLVLLLAVSGTYKRLQKVRAQRVPIGLLAVLKATLRGHLAYAYLLCRHLTRYYTLPLLLASLLVPPVFLLLFLMCSIVTGVDYVRLKPELVLGGYAVCSLLDDCAYEVGVVWGCIKHGMWKPLLPRIKTQM